ncbi:hypothetical protein AC1031_016548 [Aphanomyces cochlioides]|nr:hypothetical protein AC1031_016548 [Aphanomyces cochlioides]
MKKMRFGASLLSKLPSLTSLELAIGATDLADFFAYLAASEQITDLFLEFDQYQLTDFDLMHLTEWFRQQPVKSFECSSGDWIDADYNVKQAFYQAMFSCPTLETLEISTCDLDDIDWTQLDFSMKTLVLDQCGSSITALVLSDYAFDDIYAMECLLQVQPHTRIKQLGLNGINMDGQRWSMMALLFELSQILASAIQNNQTIEELELEYSDIALPDVEILIQSMTNPSRHVKTKRLKWITRQGCISEPANLQALAVEGGGQFVYEEV